MAYLGYQVREEKDQTEELDAWLEKHEGSAFSVWGNTPNGNRCDYGVNYYNHEPFPWQGKGIKCFAVKKEGNSCEFTTETEFFVVNVASVPKDKWGNSATAREGIDLLEGYHMAAYEGDYYTEYYFSFDLIEDEAEFVEWLLESCSELVAEISAKTVCRGFANEWRYVTTNRPIDDQEWLSAAAKFIATSREINLAEGYYLVACESDYDTEYFFRFDSIEDEEKFVEWLLESRSELVEETVGNGTDGWHYVTTNKPLDSQQWLDAVAEFTEI
jgi:hypothetical protein